jgi:hypothetical protein
MRAVTLVCFAAIGAALIASAHAQSTVRERLYEDRAKDGSVTVGILGCVTRVQAEYTHGPGGPSTVQRVKLGFAGVQSPDGRRVSIRIDGVMHDLGAGGRMAFAGAGFCRSYPDYFGVEVDREMFLRIAKGGWTEVLVGDKAVHANQLGRIRGLAERLESK